METDTAIKDCYYFRLHCHFTRKEYDGDKNKKRGKQVSEIGYEVYIIIENNGFPRRMTFKKIIHLLRNIEHYGNKDDEHDSQDEGAEEFLDYIFIEDLQTTNNEYIRIYECGANGI